MDIYCSRCGEPWDVYELHDVFSGGRKLPYKVAAKRFAAIGCATFDGGTRPTCAIDRKSESALRAYVAQELSLHPDDWAADEND